MGSAVKMCFSSDIDILVFQRKIDSIPFDLKFFSKVKFQAGVHNWLKGHLWCIGIRPLTDKILKVTSYDYGKEKKSINSNAIPYDKCECSRYLNKNKTFIQNYSQK